MARKSEKPLSARWNLLFLPAALLILLVFTNDLHEQVFSFAAGLQNANKVYKWEWGYYVILGWIAGLYLTTGVLLFVKCRISHCRKKAWIPLALFAACLACCILREVFNPLFIKMPETVVFSVVIVCESLIGIGLIPSNTEYARFFDVADISAMIANGNLDVELSSKNAPVVTQEQIAAAVQYGRIALSKDLTLKAKAITGGEVLWTEDMSVINKINDDLAEINAALAEEIDLITAENRLKEQRSKIEEQNNLYKDIFHIAKPHLKKISTSLAKATTDEEKDEALRGAVVQGVFLKRRSNLMLMKSNSNISVSELVYALREAADALTFCNVYSSVFANGDGEYPFDKIALIFACFEDCIDCALPALSACLVRLCAGNGELSVKEAIAQLPVGLCFYDETGRILLLNEQVASDCAELTGEPLYDGNAFWSEIAAGKVADDVTVTHSADSVIAEYDDGRVTMCKRILHDMDGKTVYEFCGTDISREFALKKEIEQKNESLRKMNLRLKQYGENVTLVTREREILAARIKVHGKLGSLILRTKKELTQGGGDRAALISAWNDILSLILAPRYRRAGSVCRGGQDGGERGSAHLLRRQAPEKGHPRRKDICCRRVRVRDQYRSPCRRYGTIRKNDRKRNGIQHNGECFRSGSTLRYAVFVLRLVICGGS